MLLKPSSVSILVEQIESLHTAAGEVVILLFAEQDTPDIPALIEALNARKIHFFGGIFPALIYGNQRIEAGCILKKFKYLLPPFCVSGITSAYFSGLPSVDDTEHLKNGTAIILLDGLANNLYHFLETLNVLLGESCSFIGGGAGSISLQQSPCIFSSEGFLVDAAVVCVIDQQVSLGIRQGWERLAGPFVATKTAGNAILQLNWRNAFDVYKDIVEKDSGITLEQHNFGGIAQGYPFGILREKEDDIVRDPLTIGTNGSIVCIGEVPPNTVLYILKGRPEALLQATQKAISESSEKDGIPFEAKGTFVVDCITRTTFLNEQFAEELNIIRNGVVINSDEQEPYGILSLGEIASYGEGLLELFNKTIVIGAFH
jgi:hypothetical protein